MVKISSFDEFSDLKSVILGSFNKNVFSIESQNKNDDLSKGIEILKKAYPDWYIEEVNEDIENFRKILFTTRYQTRFHK